MVPEKPSVYLEILARPAKNPSARLLAGLLACVLPLSAYIRGERSPGTPYFRGDAGNVVYFVHVETAAGLKNRNGETIITADSTPTAAIRSALERWSSIEGSALRFAEPVPTERGATALDNRNLITFADDPVNRSIVGDAIAVTRLVANLDGRLTDNDILFNPDLPFSTTLAPGTFDIEGTLTHELGHALGMDHSGSAVATMFATTFRQTTRLRTLTADDVAFARAVYPGAAGPGGSVTAGLSLRGSGAAGALAVALDPDRNITIGGITDGDGVARLAGLPPGLYVFYAEPLDEPAEVGQLGFTRRLGLTTNFRTTIVGGIDSPSRNAVTGFSDVSLNLQLDAARATLNLQGAGGALPGQAIRSRAGLVAEAGRTYRFELFGEGLDDPALTIDSISFLGTGVTPIGPLQQGEIQFTDGTTFPRLEFSVAVAGGAPLGALSAVVRNESGEFAIFTGAVEIVAPAPRPSFPFEGIVNAASFADGPLAPGMIFSIFGVDLGPQAGRAGVIDSVTGRLIDGLGDVAVLVDGRPAPLFFVSEEQINAQAPFDLEPGRDVAVEVMHQGVRSVAALVPVRVAQPALFAANGRAVALNQDGSLNSPSDPADRGETVVLFATGAGITAPALGTGELAGSGPLNRLLANTSVTLGGRQAAVSFAGMAPGFAGLVQVNLTVPAEAPSGDAPVILTAAGTSSLPNVTISVR